MRRELSPRSHSQSRSAGRSAVQPRAVSEGREELSLWSCADGVGVCAPRCFSCVDLWTVALQASLSLRFSRQEYWSGLPVPPPGPLSDRRIEPPLMSPAVASGFFTTSATWENRLFRPLLHELHPWAGHLTSVGCICSLSFSRYLSLTLPGSKGWECRNMRAGSQLSRSFRSSGHGRW